MAQTPQTTQAFYHGRSGVRDGRLIALATFSDFRIGAMFGCMGVSSPEVPILGGPNMSIEFPALYQIRESDMRPFSDDVGRAA